MKSLLATIASTERLLAEAEKNLSKLNGNQSSKHLDEIFLLTERCKVTHKSINEHKEKLLKHLIKIALSIQIVRYIRVDKFDRDYWISADKGMSGAGTMIGFSHTPRYREIPVSYFAAKSQDDEDHLDFNALCIAIINSATSYLKEISESSAAEATRLKKLFEELEPLLKLSGLKLLQ